MHLYACTKEQINNPFSFSKFLTVAVGLFYTSFIQSQQENPSSLFPPALAPKNFLFSHLYTLITLISARLCLNPMLLCVCTSSHCKIWACLLLFRILTALRPKSLLPKLPCLPVWCCFSKYQDKTSKFGRNWYRHLSEYRLFRTLHKTNFPDCFHYRIGDHLEETEIYILLFNIHWRLILELQQVLIRQHAASL